MEYVIYSVEDDKDIAKIINRTLSKQGYRVSTFPDGESFLAEFRLHKPDMVLLDMMLPDHSGSELLSLIRSDASNDGIQVIIISANSLLSDKIDGLDMGADDYIAKPFDLMELVSRVNARFRTYRKKTLLKAGDITLDEESFQCRKGEEILSLTGREFEILSLLLKRRGKVVTRDEILSAIWGEAACESRVIDMHVKELRRKLGDSSIIETVYGRGYKIS